MKKQTRTQLGRLIEEFPAIAEVRAGYKYRNALTGELVNPTTRVYVQRPDPELMNYSIQNVSYLGGSYVLGENNTRGTRAHCLYAIDEHDRVYYVLDWSDSPNERASIKRIFEQANYRYVKYLLWVSHYVWWESPAEEEEAKGRRFGKQVGRELTIVVYPRRKDRSWIDLMEMSRKMENERRGAFRHDPKVMPRLPGVHRALREGFRLHAFLSGGGLRVVSLKKEGSKSDGYGEAPHVEEALNHLDEDFQAGGLPYGKLYGPKGKAKHTHYLTGDSIATSRFDAWVLVGRTFDCWFEGKDVVLQLNGYKHYEIPKEVKKQAKASPELPWQWTDRGFRYEVTYHLHLFADDSPGYSMRVVDPPDDAPVRATFYDVTKTGRGTNIWLAMKAAFEAPEVEVIE